MPPPWFRWSWGDLGSRSHLGAAHPDRPVLLVAQSFPLPDLGKPVCRHPSRGGCLLGYLGRHLRQRLLQPPRTPCPTSHPEGDFREGGTLPSTATRPLNRGLPWSGDFYQNSWGPQMGPERGPPALELPLRRIPFEGLFWKLDSPSGLKLNFLLAKSWPLNNLTKQMNSGTCLLLLKGPTCLLNNLS